MSDTTWRKEITDEMKIRGDSFSTATCTLTEDELDTVFGNGFGGSEGKPFTCWTKARVYFPVVYDGAEWVGSVPRNPCDEASSHWGGQ